MDLGKSTQVLGYAASSLQCKRANFVLAFASYWAAQAASFFFLMIAEEGLDRLLSGPGMQDAILGVSILIAANSIGFAVSLLVMRPLRHPKRWLPYISTAVIGAATIVNVLLIQWGETRFAIPWYLVISSLILTSFCTGIILLLLYRLVLERSDRGMQLSEG